MLIFANKMHPAWFRKSTQNIGCVGKAEFVGLDCVHISARLLEKRGIDESRHGSRARPRHQRAFFCDSCSNLEIDEGFQISHKLGLDLAE